jgi:Ca2+/Na+ antiporter
MSNSIDAEEIDNAGDNSAETACLLVPSPGDTTPVDNNHNSAQTNNSTSNGNSNNNSNEHEIKFDTEEDDVESGESSKDDDSPSSVWDLPKSKCKLVLWVLSIPLIAVMFITVPDCRRPRWKNWFLVTLVLSIVWIGFYSYLMVWMITVVGHTWGIPDSVMGLTLIAAGSSVPDAIASLIVVRDGYGDMAVSNAIGSNVFDILLCLGLPWFLQTAIVNVDEPVKVYSAGLTYSALTLLSTVVLLLVATHVNGWRLTKPYGAFLMVIYILFNVLSCLYELNFFGYVHPADCLSKL